MKTTANQCDHKWIDMEDGTLDKFCVRCSSKKKQAVMASPIMVESCPIDSKSTVKVFNPVTAISPMGLNIEDIAREMSGASFSSFSTLKFPEK